MSLRACLALLLLTGCFSGYRSDDPAAGAIRVRRGAFVRDIVLTGELNAAEGAIITVPRLPSWQTSMKWLATDGAEVKQGDRVVELDNSQFVSNLDTKRQAVIQAQQQLQQKEAEWSADVGTKQLDAEKKQVDYDKAKLDAAIPREIVSGHDYEDRQIKYKRAAVELAKARDVLKSQREQVSADRANLLVALTKAERELHDAESAIAALTLRAPRSGIVVVYDHPWEGRKLQEGDGVWVGFRIAQIPEMTSLRVEAALPDVDDGRVTVGMPATVILDAYPSLRYTGRISDISAVAQESARNSLRRAFRVAVKLDQIDRARMRPGLSARVTVRTAAQPAALLASRTALDLGPKPKAHLASGRTADVKLGPCNAEACVVLDGLHEGDLLTAATRPAPLTASAAPRQTTPQGDWVSATRGDLVSGVEVTGTLASSASGVFGPPQLNNVWDFKISMMAPEGGDVKPGDAILGFDTSELQKRLDENRAESESALKEIEKRRADLALRREDEKLNLAEADARLRKTQLKLDAPPDIIGLKERKQAELDCAMAKRETEEIRQRIADLERAAAAEIALLISKQQSAAAIVVETEDAIRKMTVTAPRAGTVVYLQSWRGEKKKIGDTCWRMERVIEIPDLAHMIAKGDVDEVDAGKVAVGQRVTLRLDAHPDEELHGTIRSAAKTVVQQQGTKDPLKVLHVEIALDKSDPAKMRPGMRFQGTVELARVRGAVLVPPDAVFISPQWPVAYRRGFFGVEKVAVRLGRYNEQFVQIVSGLNAGDRVLVPKREQKEEGKS